MTGLTVATERVTHAYGGTRALTDVSVELGAGRIHGLLGRNGAGKTTLLSLVASMLRPTSGEVKVGGRLAYEDEAVMEQVCLIRESGDVVADEKISVTLDVHETLRPHFDRSVAEAILAEFGVSPKRKPGALPRTAIRRRDRARTGLGGASDDVRRGPPRPRRSLPAAVR